MRRMGPVDYVVLDFDGTFTDVEQESKGFEPAVAHMVASLIGSDRIDPLWEVATKRVDDDPDENGWSIGGRTVAPGNADPYIRASTAMRLIFSWLEYVKDPQARDALQSRIFTDAYTGYTTAVARPDAVRVLRELVASGRTVAIVTNSSTEAVAKKLDQFDPSLRYVRGERPGPGEIALFGNARKFSLDAPKKLRPQFAKLKASIRVAGLSRPVYLRRGPYYDALCKIWTNPEKDAARTLVCGDIYELDLALPEALGCQVQLVARGESTPRWAREHVAGISRGRGQCDDALSAVLGRLRPR